MFGEALGNLGRSPSAEKYVHIVLAKEVREGPNAEDKAERLMAATGTSILLVQFSPHVAWARLASAKSLQFQSPLFCKSVVGYDDSPSLPARLHFLCRCPIVLLLKTGGAALCCLPRDRGFRAFQLAQV